jgi:hypothetical protein
MRGEKPEENMLHCGDDESAEIHIFSSRFACCYLPILFSGVINWLINNKISSHAFHLLAAHMETLFVVRTSLPLNIGLTNTYIVSGLSKKERRVLSAQNV